MGIGHIKLFRIIIYIIKYNFQFDCEIELKFYGVLKYIL
jgi:hypothetical protein